MKSISNFLFCSMNYLWIWSLANLNVSFSL